MDKMLLSKPLTKKHTRENHSDRNIAVLITLKIFFVLMSKLEGRWKIGRDLDRKFHIEENR